MQQGGSQNRGVYCAMGWYSPRVKMEGEELLTVSRELQRSFQSRGVTMGVRPGSEEFGPRFLGLSPLVV